MRSADGQPLLSFDPPFVPLPDRPHNWRGGDITLRLATEEAAFLRERLTQLRRIGGHELSLLAPARPDEVRRSFNTPFWPHVLATTSVGQEGLDFHPWCSHVVHWDLSSNPLDLEQREGRVQRYAGLAVRRRLAAILRDDVLGDPATANGSPWRCVQSYAERTADESGLRPWWVLDGAEISRHVFKRPFGRDIARFAQLREQRMIYRLALGQPNQEDFIDVLSRGGDATRVLLQPLVLDLSAMGLRQMSKTVRVAEPGPISAVHS